MLTMARGAAPLAFCFAVAAAGLGLVRAEDERQVVLLGLRGWGDVTRLEFRLEQAGIPLDDFGRYPAGFTELEFERDAPWAYRLPAARVGDTLYLKAAVGGKVVKMKHQVPQVAVNKHTAPLAQVWRVPGMPAIVLATSGVRHEDVWSHMLDRHIAPAVRSGKSEKDVAAAFTNWWKQTIAAHRGWTVAIMAHGFAQELEGQAVTFEYEVKDSKQGQAPRVTQRNIHRSGAIFAEWAVPSAAGTATVSVQGSQGTVVVARQGVHVVDLAGGATVVLVVQRSQRAMAEFQQRVRADSAELFWTERTASWNRDALSELWEELDPSRGEGVSSDEFPDVQAAEDGEAAEEKSWLEYCEDPVAWIGIPLGFLATGLLAIYCCRSDATEHGAGQGVQMKGGPPSGSVPRALPALNVPLGDATAPLTASDHCDGPVRMIEPPTVASFALAAEAPAAVALEAEGASQGSVVKQASFAAVSPSEISNEEETAVASAEEDPERQQESTPPTSSRVRVISSGRVRGRSQTFNRSLTDKVKEVIARVSWRGENFPPAMLAYGGEPIVDPLSKANEPAKANGATTASVVAEALDGLLCGAPASLGDDNGGEAEAGAIDGDFHVV